MNLKNERILLSDSSVEVTLLLVKFHYATVTIEIFLL